MALAASQALGKQMCETWEWLNPFLSPRPLWLSPVVVRVATLLSHPDVKVAGV